MATVAARADKLGDPHAAMPGTLRVVQRDLVEVQRFSSCLVPGGQIGFLVVARASRHGKLCGSGFASGNDGVFMSGELGEPRLGVRLLVHRLQLTIVQLVALHVERLDLVSERFGLTCFTHRLQLLLQTCSLGRQLGGLTFGCLDDGFGRGELLGCSIDGSAMLGELPIRGGQCLRFRQAGEAATMLVEGDVELLQLPEGLAVHGNCLPARRPTRPTRWQNHGGLVVVVVLVLPLPVITAPTGGLSHA